MPGLSQLKVLSSGLEPLVDDFKIWQDGLRAYDGDSSSYFLSKVHIVLVTGDQPAVAHMMGMKGHNGKSPCRYCHIHGVCIRRESSRAAHYYFPHTNRTDIDISNLEMRFDLAGDMLRLRDEGRSDRFTRSIRDQQDRDSGICRHHYSAFHALPSIHFPRSFPPDIMHLFLLNIAKDVTYMWMGQFTPDRLLPHSAYVLSGDDWADIELEMCAASSTVPTDMGQRPRDISKHHAGFKATEWSSWLLIYSVPLLKGRLLEPFLGHWKLYAHIFYLCSQTQFPIEQLPDLNRMIIEWISDYETFYRLNAQDERTKGCTSNVHLLLHLPQAIHDCGPAWVFWQFPTERFCGTIAPLARNMLYINSTISNGLYLRQMLNHIPHTRHEQLKTIFTRQREQTRHANQLNMSTYKNDSGILLDMARPKLLTDTEYQSLITFFNCILACSSSISEY